MSDSNLPDPGSTSVSSAAPDGAPDGGPGGAPGGARRAQPPISVGLVVIAGVVLMFGGFAVTAADGADPSGPEGLVAVVCLVLGGVALSIGAIAAAIRLAYAHIEWSRRGPEAD